MSFNFSLCQYANIFSHIIYFIFIGEITGLRPGTLAKISFNSSSCWPSSDTGNRENSLREILQFSNMKVNVAEFFEVRVLSQSENFLVLSFEKLRTTTNLPPFS